MWGADTGCFAKPEKHDDDRYLRWLSGYANAHDQCLFATAPDVVGDAEATLQRAMPMLDRIRAVGVPAAFVAQDGAEVTGLPWDSFDCLFIGGTTEWKLSEASYGLVAEGKRRGKWVHVGRVNSLRRLKAFQVAGADSADGTFLAFGPDTNLPKLTYWVRTLAMQPAMGVE